MPLLEYINEEGYRLDGRKANECRLVKINLGNENIFTDADGFAFYEIGNTKILSYVQGPTELKKSDEKCSVKCEVFLSPFNVYEKKKKKTKDNLTYEISAYIRNICENIILLDLYKNSEINIFLYIIERDGGVKQASINTCILALIDAGIAIKYFISACSVLYLQNHIIVDANQLENNSGSPELTLVIELNTHKIILLEFDAEVPIDIFESMVRTCIDCCINLGNVMKLTVKENAIKLLCLNNLLNT
ncbi:exosome complex component RRP41 [Plasmodium brasilianum]|uniref:Exosome complex exonuclease RRP41, putative n=2 Tax=Plasmodium (Plasmodium) TaxID=418103 RepID=A0A1A8WTR4_PLAMA|nr:exosome complex exonuclease RRP41, putative [Plasmodium malariae]KAI4835744.1 exosome complex component RRP41 [Plasmodium brasilianum]SBS96356.1 exosome complex exonuclease RRP41, putative (RRP41) [Plasmodium malariae]SBT72217.1 exosome complex exonuclease RRP41, putative [Plasmodium malariae]SCP02676.1 exosome complex exonuclease RRP41, putative [Plasmodium malariae]